MSDQDKNEENRALEEDNNKPNSSNSESVRMAMDFSIKDSKPVYNPDLYVKKPDQSQNPQMSMNIMSTQHFMKEVDLRCDDHLINFKEDIQATRYCSDCKILCCDSCVIEFHNSHIGAAKTRIEEYFRKHKLELEDLRAKVNSSIKYKVNNAEINSIIDNHEKVLSSFFSRRQGHLEEQKAKISSIIEDEKEVCAKIKEAIQIFYREECFRRLDTPINANTELLNRIMTFLRDWDSYSKTDKVRALKNNQIAIFQSESQENVDMIQKMTEAFKGKSRVVEKKIDELLKGFSFSSEMSQVDTALSLMTETIIESKKKIAGLKYNEIIEEKVEQIYNQKAIPVVNQNQNLIPNVNPMQNQNLAYANNPLNMNLNKNLNNVKPQNNMGNDSIISNDFKLMNDMMAEDAQPFSNANNFTLSKPVDNFPQQKINQPPQQHQQPGYYPKLNQENVNANEVPQSKPAYTYELFIQLKNKSEGEIIIYDPKSGFSTMKITANHFQEPNKQFVSFPENGKCINLGSSLLITGGYINKELSSACYLLILSKNQKTYNAIQYEATVMNYGNMIEQRERHNIVFLPDKNKVIVCSGFFNSGSEVTDINSGIWKTIGKMNETRGNATIAYVNNRYIYVIGGYKILGNKNGIYHGNAEYLDVNNLTLGWKQINFGDNMLKNSAMGVINIDNNFLLLCGGFDGSSYKKEVYKVDMTEVDSPKIDRINLNLPSNYIFIHNTFLKIGDNFYNTEIGMNSIEFSPSTWGFQNYPFNPN